MAFSFSRLIISESNIITCKDAFELSKEKSFKIERIGNASCIGKIRNNHIWLGFRKGIPVWECSCGKIEEPCLHAIALSLIWDRSRDVSDPDEESIAYLTRNHLD